MNSPLPWWHVRRAALLQLAKATTPAYVYDAASVQRAIAELKSLPIARVFYALKANAHPRILRLIEAAGLGFECVSPGEVAHVLALFPELARERILFTPNFAPRHEYAAVAELGVRMTLDNLYPLEHWPTLFAGRELIVRLDLARGRGHHAHVVTAGEQSKFGIPLSELAELSALARAAGASIVGLHSHAGSGILHPETWLETAEALREAAEAHFKEVRILDLGGGLGIPRAFGEAELDRDEMARGLREFRARYPRYELWLEPGRYLVARAGVLLTTVTQLKGKGERRYIGVDAGMNSLIRPALYEAYHPIENLTRLDDAKTLRATVVGPICESGDVLGTDRALPETHEGDVLVISHAGAYGASMSSRYNLREPAAEFVLDT